MGIGTLEPEENLHVGGVIRSSGTTVSSSRALKENIADLSSGAAINTLDQLNPVWFNFRDDPEGKTHVGFIAEDAPEPIATNDRKAISNDHTTAILTKVVKEQQRQIEELRLQVESLVQE